MFSNRFVKVPVKFDATTPEQEAMGIEMVGSYDGFTYICPDDIIGWLPVNQDQEEGQQEFVKLYLRSRERGFWIYWSPERFLQEMDKWYTRNNPSIQSAC